MSIPHAVPERVALVTGTARGETELGAFDRALHAAGIHNANIVRVSSIIPEGAALETDPDRDAIVRDIQIGGVHPMVIAKATASASEHEPGTSVAAAIGAGILAAGYGVNVEADGIGTPTEALERESEQMLAELADIRDTALDSTITRTASDTVPDTGAVSAVAAAVYF